MAIHRNTTKSADLADISRRSAIGRIATGGAAGALAISAGALQAHAASTPFETPNAMAAADWQQRVGETFRVEGPFADDAPGASHATEVRLEEVREVRPKSGDPHRPTYLRPCAISLLFSSAQKLPNETFVFHHRNLGRSRLFMHNVPRAAYPDTEIYEVIFN